MTEFNQNWYASTSKLLINSENAEMHQLGEFHVIPTSAPELLEIQLPLNFGCSLLSMYASATCSTSKTLTVVHMLIDCVYKNLFFYLNLILTNLFLCVFDQNSSEKKRL